MKNFIILMSALFLFACGGEESKETDEGKSITLTDSTEHNKRTKQATNKQTNKTQPQTTGFKTLTSDTKGFDLSGYANDENICSIISKTELNELFTIPGEIAVELENSGAATCRYSWQYESKAARKQATDTGETFQFGPESKYNARAISNASRLLISVESTNKTANDFVPEILSEAEIDAKIQADADDLNNEMALSNQLSADETAAIKKSLGSMAEKRKQTLIKRNQQNTKISDVGDAAYWSHLGGGGLHVLVGEMHIYISPLIGMNAATDVNSAIRILSKIVE